MKREIILKVIIINLMTKVIIADNKIMNLETILKTIDIKINLIMIDIRIMNKTKVKNIINMTKIDMKKMINHNIQE
jgi:hypothetical protein